MRLTLTLPERALLETWLPVESQVGKNPTDARSLVAAFQDPLSPSDVVDRLAKVRRHLAEFRGPRSPIDHRAPIGRGHPSIRTDSVRVQWMSPWERAWLVVDRLRCSGRLGAPSAADLKQIDADPLNAVGIAILCLEDANEGAQLAATVAKQTPDAADRVWLHWLATGENDLLASALDHMTDFVERIDGAMEAALRGEWSKADAALPAAARKGTARTLKRTVKMFSKHLAQLISHARDQTPSRKIIDSSLAVIMREWGYRTDSDWWSGDNVRIRLPLLAIHARVFEQTGPGALLLHAHRTRNEHILQPPPRTFDTPPEVIEALVKLEQILATAVEQRRGMKISVGSPNVYDVI